MIEAVPTDPYGSYMTADQLLACKDKIANRRAYLNRFVQQKGVKLISTSASPILGLPNSMTSNNEKQRRYIERTYEHGVEQSNKHTH